MLCLYLLYVDGSGNPSLKDEHDNYYALGGVAVQEEGAKLIETELCIEKYFPDTQNRPEEIKLSAIHNGRWWRSRPEELKNRIIDDVVSLVERSNAVLFEVIIDKKRHKEKYIDPEDPCLLALRFLLTRYSRFLKRKETHGIVIYDKERDKEIFQAVKNWKTEGLVFKSVSNPFLQDEKPVKIIEKIFFVDSKYSPCMWVADFWARCCFIKKKRGDYPLYDRFSKNLDEYGRYEHPNE